MGKLSAISYNIYFAYEFLILYFIIKILDICFNLLNNIVHQVPGLVNVDFADVRAIMASAGSSLMGIGTATGNFSCAIDI